jgi:hypothetical protein
MRKKKLPFFDPEEIKHGKTIRGQLGEYHYSGFNNRPQEVRKAEDKIIAQFMNGQMIDFTSSQWYSPELTPDMWLMPKSRLETLRWTRLFYNMDPYIYSIVNMHALYPFSMFQISAQDEQVTKLYTQMAFNRKFNLYDFILQMSLSYNKFGESIVMGVNEEISKRIKDKDIKMTRWKKMVLFEPEFVEVRQAFFEDDPRYYLQVTDEMKKEIRDARSAGRDIDNVEEILHTNEILLENKNMSNVMNITDASANRGTSPVQALLRVLLYQDKVNMLKLTAIDRFRYPIEMWKIGDVEHQIKYNKDQMKEFEDYVKTAKNNPPFSLFVPPFINYEVVGYGSEKTIFDYQQDYDWTRDAIMVGLGVNKNIVLGEGPSMSNVKDLSLMKLFMIYKVVQDKFTSWIQNQFFYPIAEKNGWQTEDGDLDIPEIKWSKPLNLDRDETEDYMDLWEKGAITTKTLFSKYKGIKYENEDKGLKQEVGTIFDDGKRIRNRNIKPEKAAGKGEGETGGEGGGGKVPPLKEEEKPAPGEEEAGGEGKPPELK